MVATTTAAARKATPMATAAESRRSAVGALREAGSMAPPAQDQTTGNGP